MQPDVTDRKCGVTTNALQRRKPGCEEPEENLNILLARIKRSFLCRRKSDSHEATDSLILYLLYFKNTAIDENM